MTNRQITLQANLEQNFDFLFNSKLPEFSSPFAEAIECKHKQGKNTEDKIYALIFKKEYTANLEILTALKEIKIDTVQELVDFGKTKNLQGKECLVAIFKKPEGVRISKFISEQNNLSDIAVTTNILGQLFSAIASLHQAGITHGGINLENIFIKENLSITLKECVSEYCGFSQKAAFETFERMVCHPVGKKPYDFKADFYALGVTLICLLMGEEVFEGMPNEIAIKIKFENGSYDGFIGMLNTKKQIKLSQRNENLLKGLLHDKPSERWGDSEVNKWQRKESSVIAPSRVHRQSSNGFLFDDREFFSAKYLAYELQLNWAVAKKNLKIPELSRWISFTSKLPDIEKKFFLMTRGWQSEVIIPDEKLSRILNLLDDEGPVRIRNISFHPLALENLFLYFLTEKNMEGIEDIITLFDLGLIEGWISQQQEDADLYKPTNLGWSPKKIKHYFRKKEPGFGIERCAYEMNKNMACRSPLVDNYYCVTLAELLKDMEKAKLSLTEPLDAHLLAFLATQCRIEEAIKIKNLLNFPSVANLDELRLCAMFSLAQTVSGIESLPNLSRWMREKLNILLDKIHSNKIRATLEEKLNKTVSGGNITKMFATATDAKLIRKDIAGFGNAKRQYKILSFQIFRLKSKSNLDQIAYKLGLRAAVIFSYLISIVSILTIVLLTVKY